MDRGMGDMGHGMAPIGDMGAGMGDMHMTFFWGKNAQILFSGWPGNRGGMYALALIVVFVLAVLLEWFNYGRVISPRWSRVVAGLAQTAMHALRVGLAYVVMLAVMSFNVGVLIAVILGHTVGLLATHEGGTVVTKSGNRLVKCLTKKSIRDWKLGHGDEIDLKSFLKT